MVGIEPVKLSPGRGVPLDPQPSEILLDCGIILRADTGVVDVFEAQKEESFVFPGQLLGKMSRKGVSEME